MGENSYGSMTTVRLHLLMTELKDLEKGEVTCELLSQLRFPKSKMNCQTE